MRAARFGAQQRAAGDEAAEQEVAAVDGVGSWELGDEASERWRVALHANLRVQARAKDRWIDGDQSRLAVLVELVAGACDGVIRAGKAVALERRGLPVGGAVGRV